MPLIYFTIGPKTEELAATYLTEIKKNPETAGARLRLFFNEETLKDWFDTDLQDLTVKQLISTLMSTKQSGLNPETDIVGIPAADWSPTELKILSNVSLHCHDVDAYNNGAQATQMVRNDFHRPEHEHIIFVNGAVLTSSTEPGSSYDTPELIIDGQVNPDALFHYYEEKLMPVLLELNKAVAERNEKVVLNVPDFCCQNLTGPYEQQMRHEFPKALRRIIETHANQLTNIHTVNYDPFHAVGVDDNDIDVDIAAGENRTIHFQTRASQAETEPRAQLEFPACISTEQIKQQRLVVAKLVSGSPVSWPGNGIWAKKYSTDESVTFASVNALSKMLAAETLVMSKPNPEYQVKYNPETGREQFFRQENGRDKFAEHSEMIDVLGLRFVAHSYNILTIDYKEKPQFREEQQQTARATHGFWSKPPEPKKEDGALPITKPKA